VENSKSADLNLRNFKLVFPDKDNYCGFQVGTVFHAVRPDIQIRFRKHMFIQMEKIPNGTLNPFRKGNFESFLASVRVQPRKNIMESLSLCKVKQVG
jgi:hypothetical protein